MAVKRILHPHRTRTLAAQEEEKKCFKTTTFRKLGIESNRDTNLLLEDDTLFVRRFSDPKFGLVFAAGLDRPFLGEQFQQLLKALL